MKFSTLLGIAVAITSTNAFSLESLKQQFLQNAIVFGDSDKQSSGSSISSSFQDILSQLKLESADTNTLNNPDLLASWESLQNEFSPEFLTKKIDQYRSSKSPVTDFNNAFKNPTKPSEESKDSSVTFESLSNDKYENYSLRVKENHPELLGLDSVKQYTGYLDVVDLDKHFFYWFFESRNDPENDPIILWLNGGPGCSSATGLFFELGPSSINATLQPVYNPYSWNSNASVIFLDQPVGVGYSYTGGEAVKNTATAAKDVFVFLELFFQKFPSFLNNKFHIAGESYAGHYIPSFASEIINNADRSFELSSVLIGNGITDALIQYAHYKPMACGEGGYRQVLTDDQCDEMDRTYPKCALLTELCYNAPSALTCVPANIYCESSMMNAYTSTGLNVYDIRMQCEDDGGNCYKEMDYIDDYLTTEFVKAAVGASNIDIFSSCDETVFRNFLLDGDEMKPFQQYVAELLEYGIPVLLYAGDKDYICNWLGNHAWSDALEYSEHDLFAAKPLQKWITSAGEVGGEVKNHGIFTFLRIYDAGHMVPYDQPENSLDMVNRWVAGDYSFGK
ncbi:carboxypeptidase Y [[Candida] anglica]|uniref:Carboxypeptidase n=1 Tax=[Candida] anglica TaxID=148631 RepID=A0ABP0E553_9ASCO